MKKYKKIVLITGIILVSAFIFLPETKPEKVSESTSPTAETQQERIDYFASHGWEVKELYSQHITIPQSFTPAYEEYAKMQDKQGLPLRKFAGKDAELFVYQVKNYSPDGNNMLAELIICDNTVASSMIYSENQSGQRLSVQ